MLLRHSQRAGVSALSWWPDKEQDNQGMKVRPDLPMRRIRAYLAEASRAGKGPSLCWCCLAGSRTVDGHGLAHNALSCHGDLHTEPQMIIA